MTKVCVVVENHPSAVMGGAQYQGHLLAEELAKHAEVTYIARRAHVDQCSGYRVCSIGKVGGVRDRTIFLDCGRLRDTLKQIRPDVIYQQMRQSLTAACASYARKARIPFFFHIASDMDLNPSWVPGRLITRDLPINIIEAVSGIWGMRHATHVIAQTDRQARVLRERFGKETAVIVRNFQPLPDTLPEKSKDVIRVFWVANWKNLKRPELFVDLAERFTWRPDIEFVIAGRLSAGYDRLLQRINRMQNLKYLGELSIDEVNREMARAHFHVNTSSIEGFPNTFIQAWAQGAVLLTLSVDPDEEGMERLGIGYCTGTLDRMQRLIQHIPESERLEVARRAFAFAHEKHSMARATELARTMLAQTKKPA